MRPQALGVVVPARDEEDDIEACLEALAAARRDVAPWGVGTWVVVVDDAGRDRTAERAARALRGRGAVLRVAHHNVGAARRAGMARALRHFAGLSPGRIWLASTDADSVVPPGWLSRQLRQAAAGWDAVAGVVRVEDWGPHDPAARRTFERRYLREVDRRGHGHVHAANLGVRGSAYLAAGGFRPRPCGEDHDLWARLDHAGVRRLADPDLVVTTSGRRRGRVDGGFSADLAALDAGLREAG